LSESKEAGKAQEKTAPTVWWLAGLPPGVSLAITVRQYDRWTGGRPDAGIWTGTACRT